MEEKICKAETYVRFLKDKPPQQITVLYDYKTNQIVQYMGKAIVNAMANEPGTNRPISMPMPIEFPINIQGTIEDAFNVFEQKLGEYVEKQNRRIIVPKGGQIV